MRNILIKMQQYTPEELPAEPTEQPIPLNGNIIPSGPSSTSQPETGHAGSLREGRKYPSVYGFCRQLKGWLGNGKATVTVDGRAPDALRVAQSMLLEGKTWYTPSDTRQLKTFRMGTRSSPPWSARTRPFTSAGVSFGHALECSC